MKHQVKIENNISAFNNTFLAHSEQLCETSNREYSDWCIQTRFSIKDNKPFAHFEVSTKLYRGETLFKTDNYVELQQWITEHMDEISNQVETKADAWIEKNKSWLDKRHK